MIGVAHLGGRMRIEIEVEAYDEEGAKEASLKKATAA